MDFLWGILIAIGAGWFGINILMPKPNLASRAQRLTIIAVILAYVLFVLAALINHLDTPSGFSLTRFLIEGVLLGAIAGLITYGIAQLIHWAIAGNTMKSTAPLEASNLKVEAPTPTAQQSSVSTGTLNWTMGITGIIGTSMMLLILTREEWTGLPFFFGYGIIILASFWALANKNRSPLWVFVFMLPLGWVVFLLLKNRSDSNAN